MPISVLQNDPDLLVDEEVEGMGTEERDEDRPAWAS
jgi:hypothetical protein